MASTAVDGKTLASEQAAGRAMSWGSQGDGWITAHNSELGFHNNPDELFQTSNGVKSITQMGVELTNVGYTGSYDRSTIISKYASTTGGQVLPYTTSASHPTGSGRGGTLTSPSGTGSGGGSGLPTIFGITPTGNPFQWLNQKTNVGGVPVPNWALAGGAAYFFMGRRRR